MTSSNGKRKPAKKTVAPVATKVELIPVECNWDAIEKVILNANPSDLFMCDVVRSVYTEAVSRGIRIREMADQIKHLEHAVNFWARDAKEAISQLNAGRIRAQKIKDLLNE